MQLSIITVCFNSADHIADALDSVDRQTASDFEHIIVDGASRDSTMQVVGARGRTWRRSYSEPDGGIYEAMNKGIGYAAGDIVGFINSDDFYASDAVLETVARAFDDPTIGACWGDLCYVQKDDPTRVVRFWKSSPFKSGLFGTGWCPPHPTLFVRRAILERHGAFDLSYRIAADFELMVRLIEVHRVKVTYIPRVLVHMRMGGTSNRSLGNIWQQNREIWRALQVHRLRPSLLSFAGRKLAARARQFLARPAA